MDFLEKLKKERILRAKEQIFKSNELDSTLFNLMNLSIRIGLLSIDTCFEVEVDNRLAAKIKFEECNFVYIECGNKINIYEDDEDYDISELDNPSLDIQRKIDFGLELFQGEDEPDFNDYIPIIYYFWQVESFEELELLLFKDYDNVFKYMGKYKKFKDKCFELLEKYSIKIETVEELQKLFDKDIDVKKYVKNLRYK